MIHELPICSKYIGTNGNRPPPRAKYCEACFVSCCICAAVGVELLPTYTLPTVYPSRPFGTVDEPLHTTINSRYQPQLAPDPYAMARPASVDGMSTTNRVTCQALRSASGPCTATYS